MSAEYCKIMLLLQWPNWWQIKDIKPDNTWEDQMVLFLSMETCPNFVKADVVVVVVIMAMTLSGLSLIFIVYVRAILFNDLKNLHF